MTQTLDQPPTSPRRTGSTPGSPTSRRRSPCVTSTRGREVRPRQLLARPGLVHLEHQDPRGPRPDRRHAQRTAGRDRTVGLPHPRGCDRGRRRGRRRSSSSRPAVGRGIGHLRLNGDDQAWTLLTALQELKGHEEPKGPSRVLGAVHGDDPDPRSWAEKRQAEDEPHWATPRSRTRWSSAADRAASRSARGCGSWVCPRSSSTSTSDPVTSGASGTSRCACTTRSGTTTCRTCRSRRTGRCSRRRTRSATGSSSTPG